MFKAKVKERMRALAETFILLKLRRIYRDYNSLKFETADEITKEKMPVTC